MTKKVSQSLTEHYIVPARQLSGTRDEVLAQIDELILGLTGLRQLVSLHGPTPAEAPRRKLHLVKGFLKVLFVIGLVRGIRQFPFRHALQDQPRRQRRSRKGRRLRRPQTIRGPD